MSDEWVGGMFGDVEKIAREAFDESLHLDELKVTMEAFMRGAREELGMTEEQAIGTLAGCFVAIIRTF